MPILTIYISIIYITYMPVLLPYQMPVSAANVSPPLSGRRFHCQAQEVTSAGVTSVHHRHFLLPRSARERAALGEGLLARLGRPTLVLVIPADVGLATYEFEEIAPQFAWLLRTTLELLQPHVGIRELQQPRVM